MKLKMNEEEIYEELDHQKKEENYGYELGYQVGILNQDGYVPENCSIYFQTGLTKGYIDGYQYIEKGMSEENKYNFLFFV